MLLYVVIKAVILLISVCVIFAFKDLTSNFQLDIFCVSLFVFSLPLTCESGLWICKYNKLKEKEKSYIILLFFTFISFCFTFTVTGITLLGISNKIGIKNSIIFFETFERSFNIININRSFDYFLVLCAYCVFDPDLWSFLESSSAERG